MLGKCDNGKMVKRTESSYLIRQVEITARSDPYSLLVTNCAIYSSRSAERLLR